ncbi:hypothetical protein [Streptomyces sp.]
MSKAQASAEAECWRAQAAARYDELLTRHPEAYADHAEEFWLTVGGDPERALRLARQNLMLRPTPADPRAVRRAMCQFA